MISLNAAFNIIDTNSLTITFSHEIIATVDALNRILATDQKSLLDIPPFNRSAMDGYAILQNDDSKEFKIIETVAAGDNATNALKKGTAIKIMTGAPVPAGAGKIVPNENVTEKNGEIIILSESRKTNIARQGEDVKCGDVILKSGTKINAIAIANLCSVGIKTISVYKKINVAIISTGDEIVDDFQDLKPGKIMNANGPMLQALCQQHGFDVCLIAKIKDDYQATIEAINKAITIADVIILSGGVSVGDFDYVSKAIVDIGFKIHFDKVAIKPGKPTVFGSKNNKLIFGLPGNPVAAFLAFNLFVLRCVSHCLFVGAGFSLRLMTQVKFCAYQKDLYLPISQDVLRKPSASVEFVPCKLLSDGTIMPVEFHGSAHLAALNDCDGFFLVEENIATITRGARVQFLPTA